MSIMPSPSESMKPNITGIPNIILDILMPQLNGNQEKIVRAICRQTYGWHKDSDKISNSQMLQKTGLKDGPFYRDVKILATRKIIIRILGNGRTMTEYAMNLNTSEWEGVNLAPPKIDTSEGVKKNIPGGVKKGNNKRNYQKKLSKEKEEAAASMTQLPQSNMLYESFRGLYDNPNNHTGSDLMCKSYIDTDIIPSLTTRVKDYIGLKYSELNGGQKLIWTESKRKVYGRHVKEIIEAAEFQIFVTTGLHDMPNQTFDIIRARVDNLFSIIKKEKSSDKGNYWQWRGMNPTTVATCWNELVPISKPIDKYAAPAGTVQPYKQEKTA